MAQATKEAFSKEAILPLGLLALEVRFEGGLGRRFWDDQGRKFRFLTHRTTRG